MRFVVLLGLLTVSIGALGCSESPASARANGTVPPPVSPAESPEQVVLNVSRAVADGKLHVVWDALPASYQKDVTGLIHEFAGKMDRDLWNKGFAIVGKLATVLQSKKDIILGMKNLRENPKFDAQKASDQWDRVVAPLRTIGQSELANLDSLKRIDVRRFLGTTGSQLVSDVQTIARFSSDGQNKLANLSDTKATLVSRDGDSAVVRIEVPGEEPKDEAFVRVEGKWITKDMADKWPSQMQDAHSKLAKQSSESITESKPQVMQAFAAADSVLNQLNEAQTPEQFEQTMKMGMFQMMGIIMSFSQASDGGGPT